MCVVERENSQLNCTIMCVVERENSPYEKLTCSLELLIHQKI